MKYKEFRKELLVLKDFKKEQESIEKAIYTILYEPSWVKVGDGLLKAHIELLEQKYQLEYDSIWDWYYQDNADNKLIKKVYKK